MTTKPKSVFWALPRQLVRDTRGVTLALVAAAVSALIGFTGLGVETGLWYAMKRQNQSAADVAALSGAFEVLAGQGSSLTATQIYANICGFAKRDATRNGFTFLSFTCPTSTPACTSPSSGQMCANNPPATAGTPNFGNANAVEVILAQQQNALFASLSLANVTIDTRAVAVISVLDQACVLALEPTASNAIFIKGNPTLNMPNCSVVADSTSPSAIHLQGNASIIADTLVTAGGVSTTGTPSFTLNKPAQTNAPTVPDPYASTLTHSFLTTGMPPVPPTSNCAAAPVKKATTTYPANSVFCGGLSTPSGGGTIDLSPGTYWVTDGDLALNSNGVLECTLCNGGSLGVTIILTTAKSSGGQVGTVTEAANATINSLNAPNSGSFKGLLIVQDSFGLPAGTTFTSSNSTFQGGPGATLNGLVYFPKSNMSFQGNPIAGGSGCLILVVNKLDLSGDSQLNSTGCSAAGVSPPTVKTVALAE
jgi:hypothetical protein